MNRWEFQDAERRVALWLLQLHNMALVTMAITMNAELLCRDEKDFIALHVNSNKNNNKTKKNPDVTAIFQV